MAVVIMAKVPAVYPGELDVSYLAYDGELPNEWELPEDRIPTPRNQNNDYQCVAWVFAAIIEIMLKVRYGINKRISTAHIYGDHRNPEARTGKGMNEDFAASYLVQDGAVFLDEMPYLIEPEACYDYVQAHPELQEEAKRLASLFKGFVRCRAQSSEKRFTLIKQALMKYKYPVAGELPGHEVLFVGWKGDCLKYRDVDGTKWLKLRDYDNIEGGIVFVPSDKNIPFVDVPEKHWARKAIEQAYILGFVNGNDKGELGPDKSITTAQVIQLIMNVYNDVHRE